MIDAQDFEAKLMSVRLRPENDINNRHDPFIKSRQEIAASGSLDN